MPRKLRELRAQLRKAGFVRVRSEGSHETWEHPDYPTLKMTLAGADGADARQYYEKLLKELLVGLDHHLDLKRD